MSKVTEMFGSLVFNEEVMRQRLSGACYQGWKTCIAEGKPLTLEIANEIANAMKDWAIEKGATHYTHWFQPMTGVTAEKHDSFITPSFPERNRSGASPTPPPAPPAACAPRLRPVATRPGTPLRLLLSRTAASAFPQCSAPTAATPWTKRPRSCAPWMS